MPMQQQSNHLVCILLACTIQFSGYALQRKKERKKERKKMNQIEIFTFGYLDLVKSQENLQSGFSNKQAKGCNLLHSSALFLQELLLYLIYRQPIFPSLIVKNSKHSICIANLQQSLQTLQLQSTTVMKQLSIKKQNLQTPAPAGKTYNTKTTLIVCMAQLVILTTSYNIFNSSYTVAKTSIGVTQVAPIVTKQKQLITREFLLLRLSHTARFGFRETKTPTLSYHVLCYMLHYPLWYTFIKVQ